MENNIPKGCLPFDIEAVKKGAKCVTRDGREAKYCGGSYNPNYPYWFEIEDIGEQEFTKEGAYFNINEETSEDLFLVDPNYVGTELPQEQPYEVTMIVSLPEKQISNPEFEFKQEIAAQFVRDVLNNPENKTYGTTRLVDVGLSTYKDFLQRSKEFFSTTQAPE